MIVLFFKGILAGLLFAFSFGPAFFANISASMSRGFSAGAMVVIGISLTDISFTLLSIFGLATFLNDPTIQFWITLIGGLIIIAFGAMNVLRPVSASYEQVSSKKKDYHLFFLQGILINGLNPYIVIFWAGIVSTTIVEMSISQNEALIFFAGVLITTLSLDLVKSALADKIYNFLGNKKIALISKIIGFIFLTIGLSLLISLLI